MPARPIGRAGTCGQPLGTMYVAMARVPLWCAWGGSGLKYGRMLKTRVHVGTGTLISCECSEHT
jgi:hypothetical protein